MLTQLETQKTEMLKQVEGWSDARLMFRPAPDTWSATEVLDHVVKVESGIFNTVRKSIDKQHPRSIRDRIGFVFLDQVMRSKMKVKTPAAASATLPSADLNLIEIAQRWDRTRVDLAQFLSGIAPEKMSGGVFRHPVSGWMSVPQVLSFFSAHLKHHGYQLENIQAQSSSL